MIKLDLQTVAEACHGELQGENLTFLGVGTDTRADLRGKLFIAIKGERFDAHDFVSKAEEQGAIALLVARAVESALPQVIVADTRIAMGELARHWREHLALKVVGLTGSVGKTTVKEMLASILRTDAPTLATKGNFNNDIGVPLTLFDLSGAHKYAVIEMGANHKGEIGYCAGIAKPNVALITKIAPAHLEGFGSIEGVAHAKSEIYQALSSDGIAVLNNEIAFKGIVEKAIGGRRCIRYGLHKDHNDLYADQISLDDSGCARFTLHCAGEQMRVQLTLPGEHNVSNALAAAGAAHALRFSLEKIATGLAQTPSVKGRVNQRQAENGALVIDDTYNANLTSMCAALDLLASKPTQTIAILGDMGELGEAAVEMHREVGQYAKSKNIAALYTLGNLSEQMSKAFGAGARHFTSIDELNAHLQKTLTGREAILVKGSRSAKMERVVAALCGDEQPATKQEQRETR
ncbi:UDP-N-acetylmuramoyl-tripeptide--D-alanyl-D-alanine ligase [Permianibacter aggregans]|uniref:UDP-N-acetylmuramoyl-tripeptide--D-alanyl-D-alanine ligase n=1 Tax=Permianibacter aggregans TaxID=1510150 RepID=A0A4V6PWM4_9GAMM|nr:UDP-N-acetylmuramoyl-tripeptide--D-alanyl-D-alanine ligase [Permianibacter aggregans]QGX39035.1 UDP-N-acetylmuramoyl-tripeptide--D-alanyl-D-alanine ligase [Permianibacter aggregans]TDQ44627.1 UDP-N-acetylmuramoyl-tripeptide--D-alanyl-D-alanine ligase [Permianibacter aggregans]